MSPSLVRLLGDNRKPEGDYLKREWLRVFQNCWKAHFLHLENSVNPKGDKYTEKSTIEHIIMKQQNITAKKI